jgi:protein-S-isoprenylcysteine O-methyltransferase Ste14
MDNTNNLPPRLIARYLARETMGVVVMAAALFLSAGRLDWIAGWAAVVLTAGWVIGTAVVILRGNPQLLRERLGPRQGAKTWDTAILSVLGISQLARYIVAGLDQRYGWSSGFPLAVQIAAFVLCGLGYGLTVWATYSNAYFSQIVRIQSERGHAVASGGPYRYVRHPGYLGAVLTEAGMPFLLASWWALIPSGLGALLLILRTDLEDRTLKKELPGYTDYAGQVRKRLIPGLW